MRPTELLAVTAILASYWRGVAASYDVAWGGSCSQADNGLNSATGTFLSDCDYTTYCADNGTCAYRGCRADEYPIGYNNYSYSELPPKCAEGQFCPDESDACLSQIAVGEGCQLDRDDECAPPSNSADLASKLNVNGSICLNFVCQWANVTAGDTCIVENRAYEVFTGNGGNSIQIVSRDNCYKGLYCDGTSLQCVKQVAFGAVCTANKECVSYNCVSGKCAKATDEPNQPASWVYAIVAALIIIMIVGVFVGLFFIHRKGRMQNQIRLEQYYKEQVAYRQSLMSLAHAKRSLMALPPDTPLDVARQSLLNGGEVHTQYRDRRDSDQSGAGYSRPSSSLNHGWTGEEKDYENDVLVIPSGGGNNNSNNYRRS